MRLNRLVLPLYLLPLAFNESCSAKPTVHILNQDLVFHVIDTGQGSSALVELPDNKLFLIDSGYDTTKTRQFFNGLSNRQIDYFLTTHGDQDHINNGKWIYENFEVKYSFLPRLYSNSLNVKDKYNVQPIQLNSTKTYTEFLTSATKDNNWEYTDGHDFDKFKTSNEYTIDILEENIYPTSNQNDYSPIIIFSYRGKSICISGDATSVKENAIVQNFELPKCEAYVIGHHGSNSSSSANFLKKIAPNYSFYSSGDVNGTKYGLPNLQALQRIKPYSGTNIYGTEFCGNISFRISHETGKLVLDESYEKTTTAWNGKGGERLAI